MKKGISTQKKTRRILIPRNQTLNLVQAKATRASIWTGRMRRSYTPNCWNNKKVQWLCPSKKTKAPTWTSWSIKRWSSCSMFASDCIVLDWKLWNKSLSILGPMLAIKKHSYWIWMRLCSMLSFWPVIKMNLMMMAILFSLCRVKRVGQPMCKDSSRWKSVLKCAHF